MPVTTRRQAAASQNTTNKKVDKEPVVLDADRDSWDVPEATSKSSMIKTYSKKQPFKTYQSKRMSKSGQDSHGVSSKLDSAAKPSRNKSAQETLSLTKNVPFGTTKALSTDSKNSTKLPSKIPTVQTTSRSAVKRSRNKTRLAVESMTTCTMLADKHSDIDLTTEDMLLCSVVQMGIKSQKNKNIRNSTVLAACDTINEDFVPNEISVIEGHNELHNTVISEYSERNQRTPENQPIQTVVQSVKKVRFHVSQKTPKNQNGQSAAKRYNLRQTPYRNEMLEAAAEKSPEKPKTSSPDPNKDTSTLHCEISTLLIDDKQSKKESENTRITQDTEKLLDFEPVPLQCSENVHEDPSDVTPETCNLKVQTSSAKRRRRLCYQLDEQEIPACILLDIPVRKTKKKSAIWIGKNAHVISIKELESFPDDILL